MRRVSRAGLVFPLLALGLAACASPPEPEQPLSPTVENGRRLAERACAGCHSMSLDRQSVYRAAPPFWMLPGRHTPESLQRVAADSTHDPYGMPTIVLTRMEAAELIAYIDALARAGRSDRTLHARPCIATAC